MEKTIRDNQGRRPNADSDGMTVMKIFEFYLDSFIELYRHKCDLLRFKQFFYHHPEKQLEALKEMLM